MISLAIKHRIAVITLCRAPVNAINDEWVDQLNTALDDIEADPQTGAIWLRSDQRLFSAGADLNLMRSRFDTSAGRARMIAFVRRLQEVYARLEKSPVASIAEISGAAMGGGLELALACDFRVISNTAKVGLPEARLGLLPGAGGTQRLTRCCGDAVARRLILGAEIVDGETAAKLGLAQWAVAGGEIEQFAGDLAARIAALSSSAVAACKSCIAAAHDDAQDGFELELAGTHELLASDETQQLVRGFLDRDRAPGKNKATTGVAVKAT